MLNRISPYLFSGQTHQQVWKLALPMIISNLSVPLLGMVDTAVMGHLPAAHYLGSVALGATIFSFVFWGFGFLRMGTTGVVAQAFGEGDQKRLKSRLFQSLVLAWCCSVVLLIIQYPLIEGSLFLLNGTPQVEKGAAEYFFIRIWAAPATLSNYVVMGCLLGMQQARAAMWMLVTANVVNALLDVLFVWVLSWGVQGVAAASCVGEYAALVVGLRALAQGRYLQNLLYQWREQLRFSELKALLVMNRDLMLRTVCLLFAFAFFTDRSAALGEIALATNMLLLNFQSLMAYGLDGFAHAAEALVGEAVGAKRRKAFVRVVVVSGFWSGLVAGVFTLFYALFGGLIINLLTDLPEIRSGAKELMFWVLITPLLSVWSFWLDGVFVGATWSKAMRDVMLICVCLVLLPVYWLLRDQGINGLWIAFTGFLASRSIFMLIAYGYLSKKIAGNFVAQRADH